MSRATLAGVSVGDGLDVAVVGVVNVSPESFYGGSVVEEADRLLQVAEAMAEAGAAWLDVGAMSTAPYLATRIPAAQEADRLHWAVGLLAGKLDRPLSADTSRTLPAQAALDAGARIINDVTGLGSDPDLGALVATTGAGLVLMASPAGAPTGLAPLETVRAALQRGLALAGAAGILEDRIVVDPGIGFFRSGVVDWAAWDCQVLAGLGALRALGRPIHVGVSRKSFIGALASGPPPGHGPIDAADRLPGSLAATAAAVLAGAHVIRTHDVAETVQAVRIAQAIRGARDREAAR